MRFSSIISTLALVASAFAANDHNTFNLPTGTLVFTAGQPKQLTWSNLAGNTVTLKLRSGTSNDLQDVTTIVAGLQNTGSYTWTPDAKTVEGADYAIEIINDQDPTDVNYTTQFPIVSDVKAVASSGTTGVVTATSASLVTSQPTGPATASGTTASGSSGMTTMTGSAASTSGTSSPSSSRTAAASSSSAASGTVPTNAAAKPAAGAAGALLAVAAGFAIAL